MIPLDLALLIALEVCEGLSHAHATVRCVHGELCPWHIMVGFDGTVKLLNLGLTPIASTLKADTEICGLSSTPKALSRHMWKLFGHHRASGDHPGAQRPSTPRFDPILRP